MLGARQAKWMHGPRWRWFKAQEELALMAKGESPVFSDDRAVSLARRAQNMAAGKYTKDWLDTKWPETSCTLKLGTVVGDNTMRSMLERTMVQGKTRKQAETELVWLQAGQYELYSQWFFDIADANQAPEWVDQQVVRRMIGENRQGEALSMLLAIDGFHDDASANMLLGQSAARTALNKYRNNELAKRSVRYLLSPAAAAAAKDPNVMEAVLTTELTLEQRAGTEEQVNVAEGYTEALHKATHILSNDEIKALQDAGNWSASSPIAMSFLRKEIMELEQATTSATAEVTK